MKEKKISKFRKESTQIDAWDTFGWKQMMNCSKEESRPALRPAWLPHGQLYTQNNNTQIVFF